MPHLDKFEAPEAPAAPILVLAVVIEEKSVRLLKSVGVPTNITSSIDLLLTIFAIFERTKPSSVTTNLVAIKIRIKNAKSIL